MNAAIKCSLRINHRRDMRVLISFKIRIFPLFANVPNQCIIFVHVHGVFDFFSVGNAILFNYP